ncbi:MAG: hypothetical protein K0Q49_2043 [Haloplasmataceae bacterium]|jgi:hypothetical protein|nr:hypothetical protein [Haloplasmataceae bacterium]
MTQEEYNDLFSFYYEDHLVDMLSQFTKEDLNDIRKLYNIKGLSQLNKTQIVDILSIEIINHLDDILGFMTEKQYYFLKEFLKSENKYYSELHFTKIYFFLKRCLMFPCLIDNKPIYYIPIEIKQHLDNINFNALEKKVKENTLILEYAKGITKLYGAIDVLTFTNKLNKFTNSTFEPQSVLKIIENQLDYNDLGTLDNYIGLHFIENQLSRLITMQKGRPDIEYYPFDKATILDASINGYVEDNPYFKKFMEFVCIRFNLPVKKAHQLAAELMNKIKTNSGQNELLQMIIDTIVIKDMSEVNEILPHLQQLYNNTKQWSLKGYSPFELKKFLTIKSETLTNAKLIKFDKNGRNDPCPCGSGKKYKHCCLNKNKNN